MGFSAPKPDPKIAQQQAVDAATAKANKIDAIQGQLSNEDKIRTRLYGFKPNALYSNFGTAPAGQNPGVTAGLRFMAQNIFGGAAGTSPKLFG